MQNKLDFIGLANRMKSIVPKITNYPQIEVIINNQLLLDDVLNIKNRILKTFVLGLHNSELSISYRLADQEEVGKVLTKNEVLELLMDLGASDEQLDCPFLYASAKAGHAVIDLNDTPKDMAPLFDAILKYIPAPEGDPDADTQVLISTIDYNEYVGRIGVGKVENGKIAVNQELTLLNHHDLDKRKKVKISKLYEFDGLNKVEVKEATIGSIVAISGIADIHIGDTLCGGENPEAIPFQKISEPTIAMNLSLIHI